MDELAEAAAGGQDVWRSGELREQVREVEVMEVMGVKVEMIEMMGVMGVITPAQAGERDHGGREELRGNPQGGAARHPHQLHEPRTPHHLSLIHI